MPRPTTAQLRKINKLSQTELKEDQVYVFRSLSADTLPVSRRSWFGEYSINMTEKFLQKLKKDYTNGVGLLASHDNSRLPFGRTFDAEIMSDEVRGEDETVKTLYIDHYMVTHMEGEGGERRALNTEIGMTTQEIADHIEVGHTFDTSIGFSMQDPKCSVCKNSLHDYALCEHIPGLTYTVDGEQVRCDIVVEQGEGVENSLVYAGAVNRALIQRTSKDGDSQELSTELHSSVKLGDVSLYNVDDVKNLPMGAEMFCFLSKGNMQLFTTTTDRRDFNKFLKGREEMSDAQKTETPVNVTLAAAEPIADVVLKSVHEAALSAKDAELQTALSLVSELEGKLSAETAKVTELSAKAELVETFTSDLISETVRAGVAARGNAFNAERYEKYLGTLSVSEIKEELSAMKEEFSGAMAGAAAQVTDAEVGDRADGAAIQMSKSEMRTEAAKVAMAKFRKDGGNLEELTKQAMAELEANASK